MSATLRGLVSLNGAAAAFQPRGFTPIRLASRARKIFVFSSP
jgi:hypothetical protein